MRIVKLAATQFAMAPNIPENVQKAKEMVRKAAKEGANIILLPELFENVYFCQTESYERFAFAEEFENSPAITTFSALAKELGVVLPVSYFEKAGNCYFNSIAIIDADGTVLGQYRKSHIPTGECYEEKFYFSPGDTGFRVFATKFGKIGVGICWDQWFPETARILALKGAEMLFFPTAIGSEPVLDKDSKDHWQHVMQGHAAANIMPVVASNRIGTEEMDGSSMTFFGSSFIANEFGVRVQELGRTEEGILVHEFDLDLIEKERRDWGVFRDRRVDLYAPLLKLDDSK